MIKSNNIIRNTLKKHNFKQWKLAEILGISETTLVRKLRKELSQDEQEKIIKLIKEYSK